MVEYYAWGALTLFALACNHLCARQVRHAGSGARVMGTFVTLAVCNIFVLVCWHEMMRLAAVDDPAWVILFIASIAGAVVTGLIHVEREVGSVSLYWSAVAGLTRPFRNFEAARKEFARKVESSNDPRGTKRSD